MRRRPFLTSAAIAAASLAAGPLLAHANTASTAAKRPEDLPMNDGKYKRYRPAYRYGYGCAIALGDMRRTISNADAQALMKAAWDAGIRYFDTSPWYGLGLSERRVGYFLSPQERQSYVLSSKSGRLLKPEVGFSHDNWQGVNNFNYTYDYSASATRRSVEDSLQRMGVPSLDVVFIHDLSPDNKDLGEGWKERFEQAKKGAMPELVKMREEGLIKGWGMGVNTLEPSLGAIEASDPDIILQACQYSLIQHADAVERLFPVCRERDVSLVIGSPLNSGYLAGNDYFNYSKDIPKGMAEKRAQAQALAKKHGTDLRTVGLHFCNAPDVVSAIIPGGSTPEQIRQNVASMSATVPAAFWREAKQQGLIHEDAPVPA
ncbi:aldo/keto reductase [Pseudomonas matsuisoli]|uniref:L-fucose dehydrogenase n=1 Tax=Pseudomonas matsuisoli TaxID=1515666 RepID=A0A917PLF3_9PSED|nr:aldo/keto reductase [Pseudomonas matsuisoli]GGJ83936.1 L-fucose dehydrogenase [Pseudomonas matsuisoli]